MATLFISDLHLEDRRPDTTALLLRLLSGPARQAEAVYILGDLFEYWIGDDVVTETARRVAEAISELVSGGTSCHFMHGNRDFLVGESFASLCAMDILTESLVIDLYGTATLLLHGDTLCTDDIEYQAFRRQARDPAWQASVLALTPRERLELANSARDASKQHTGSTAMEIMDVNDAAVRAAFAGHGVPRMIHGHTHRPAVHNYTLEDGSTAQRIVLADWYDSGSYLRVDSNGSESVTLTA